MTKVLNLRPKEAWEKQEVDDKQKTKVIVKIQQKDGERKSLYIQDDG